MARLDANRLRFSDDGVKYLTELEGGAHLKVYDDGFGYPTIGVGHLIDPDEMDEFMKGITREKSNELLKEDVREAERLIWRVVKVPLTQAEYDALVCFAFNIGNSAFKKSTLVKVLNRGEYEHVPYQMTRWNKVKGKTVKGLVNRRRESGELFARGDYKVNWEAYK